MTQDDRMETITDPAEIRATSDERGCCDCRTFDQHERECILPDERTTPAPVGAAVALDLDALHETICDKFTGMAEVRQSADLLVAEVRRLVKFRDWWKASSLANAEDVRRLTAICHDWRDRSEAAEAEVVTLRARLARSRSRYCGCGWCCSNNADGVVPGDAHLICSRYRAALATTGEGQ